MSIKFYLEGIKRSDIEKLAEFYKGFKNDDFESTTDAKEKYLAFDKVFSSSEFICEQSTDFYKGIITGLGLAREILLSFGEVTQSTTNKGEFDKISTVISIAAGKCAAEYMKSYYRN